MKLTKLTDYQESLLQALPPARQRWNRQDIEKFVTSIKNYEDLIATDSKEHWKSYLETVLQVEKQKLIDLEIALSEGLEFQKRDLPTRRRSNCRSYDRKQ